MLRYSSAHTVSYYSTVQHTLYHVRVQFNTHSIMLQYSLKHTVSFYSTVQHTLYHVSVCTVSFPTLYSIVQHTVSCYSTVQHTVSCYSTVQHTVSCYSTVQHTLYHITVQFNTHSIMSLYVLFLSQHCTVQFNTHCIMLQYNLSHTVSCYRAV